jgi:hypothetical protein
MYRSTEYGGHSYVITKVMSVENPAETFLSMFQCPLPQFFSIILLLNL